MELSHEEPLNSVARSSDIHDIKVALPSEPGSIDANARTETTQDAGIKEHTLESAADVISIAEETMPSKLEGFEDVLKLETLPGSKDVTIPEVKTDVSEQHIDDALNEGDAVPKKKKPKKKAKKKAVTMRQTDERIDIVEERKVENYVEDNLTKVKKEITIIKHVKHYKEVTMINDKPSDSVDKSELVGTEVLENVLRIAPGVTDETSPGVETKTSEQDINETLEDGTWLKKKVKLTTVRLGERLEEPAVTKERSDEEIKTDEERKVEAFVKEDGTKVKKEITIIRHLKTYKETTMINGKPSETGEKKELVGIEVLEDVLEIAPDVMDETSPGVETKTSEQDINETLDDGTWLKKMVKLTTVRLGEKTGRTSSYKREFK